LKFSKGRRIAFNVASTGGQANEVTLPPAALIFFDGLEKLDLSRLRFAGFAWFAGFAGFAGLDY